jgi:type III pantothenate kinase
VAYRTPETLGADRLAAAAAALSLGGGRPVVVIDAGTAVTVDAVDVRSGQTVYLGGAIAPGPEMLARSLARGTGALPHISFDGPILAVGDSTTESLRTGIAGFLAGGTGRLVEQMSRVLAAPPVVVATGGASAWLTAHGVPVDRLAPTLVLDGIRALCIPRLVPTGAAAPSRQG